MSSRALKPTQPTSSVNPVKAQMVSCRREFNERGKRDGTRGPSQLAPARRRMPRAARATASSGRPTSRSCCAHVISDVGSSITCGSHVGMGVIEAWVTSPHVELARMLDPKARLAVAVMAETQPASSAVLRARRVFDPGTASGPASSRLSNTSG